MRKAFIDYYENLLGTVSFVGARLHPGVISEGSVLSTDQQVSLCNPFSENDIKVAL